jgi:hypothetical protein
MTFTTDELRSYLSISGACTVMLETDELHQLVNELIAARQLIETLEPVQFIKDKAWGKLHDAMKIYQVVKGGWRIGLGTTSPPPRKQQNRRE